MKREESENGRWVLLGRSLVPFYRMGRGNLYVLNLSIGLALVRDMALLEGKRAWLSWAAVGLLIALCAILAVLQYRWIGEIAGLERDRLQDELQSRLNAKLSPRQPSTSSGWCW